MLILLSLLILIYVFRSKIRAFLGSKEELQQFLHGHPLRGCDPFGCGHYGAPRGHRTHKGLDIVKQPHEKVVAPFDCIINRIGKPYADDDRYFLVEVIGINKFKGYKAKLMYVTTPYSPSPTKIYRQNDFIGYAQNISAKYGLTMTNHIHFELYDHENTNINPQLFT